MSESFARSYFARAARKNRLAHAYLLWGPETEERDTAARDIARSLVCREGPRENTGPCGACEVCRGVAAGAYGGFVELPREKPHIDIEQIRSLAETLAVSFDSRRVVFGPKLERLTLPAANAFLKILEEPGGETVYVLTTGRPENLLPTILSRCHRIMLCAGHRGHPSVTPPELIQILTDPQVLARADLSPFLDSLPGNDKREQIASLLSYLLGELRASPAAGEPEREEGKGIFGPLSRDECLTACEEILALAEELQGNVNPELILEGLIFCLTTVQESRSA